MVGTAIHIICCGFFVLACVFDERELKIPRYVSYLELLASCCAWLIRHYVNQEYVLGNLFVSIGLFAVIFFFYKKGQIGRADLYLVLSMFVLLSEGQSTRALIWEENMLLCIGFMSAAIRLGMRSLARKMLVQKTSAEKKYLKKTLAEKKHARNRVVQPGCPFAIHLLLGYLITRLW